MLSIFLITFFSHTLFSFVSSLFVQVHVLHYLFRYSFSRYIFFTIYFHSSFSRYTFFTFFFTLFFHFFFPGTLFSHFFFTLFPGTLFSHFFFTLFFTIFFPGTLFSHFIFTIFFQIHFFSEFTRWKKCTLRVHFFYTFEIWKIEKKSKKSVPLRGKQSKLVKKSAFSS